MFGFPHNRIPPQAIMLLGDTSTSDFFLTTQHVQALPPLRGGYYTRLCQQGRTSQDLTGTFLKCVLIIDISCVFEILGSRPVRASLLASSVCTTMPLVSQMVSKRSLDFPRRSLWEQNIKMSARTHIPGPHGDVF